MNKTLDEFKQEEKFKEAAEYQKVLLAINTLLQMEEGRTFFSYIFKNLDVGCVPEMGVEGNSLHDHLGFLRAGNSIYKLACQADFKIAGYLLAKMEKEKHDFINELNRIENSATDI